MDRFQVEHVLPDPCFCCGNRKAKIIAGDLFERVILCKAGAKRETLADSSDKYLTKCYLSVA
jgi:hypothetical protein